MLFDFYIISFSKIKEKLFLTHSIYKQITKNRQNFDTFYFVFLSSQKLIKSISLFDITRVIAFHKPFYTLFRTTVSEGFLVLHSQRFFFEYYHLLQQKQLPLRFLYHLVLRNFLCCWFV